MRIIVLSFLCLFLFSFLTIAQDGCQGKQLPYGVSIAGQTDSITVDAILQAGKPQCTHKAFEIISFTVSTGGICLIDGLYTECHNSTGNFSSQAVQLISRMGPGSRLFLDCIRVKNQVGDTFLLKNQVFRIRSK